MDLDGTIGMNGQILPVEYDINSNQKETNQGMNNKIQNQMNQLSLQTKIKYLNFMKFADS